MRAETTQYMFDCQWTDDFKKRSSMDYYSSKEPEMIELHDTIILPAKESSKMTWGIGGPNVADPLLEEIRMGIAFGGRYPFSAGEVVSKNETVYYVPVIMKHWGHFLIDVLSRFWFILDNDKNYKIAFCSLDFQDGNLQGNYAEAISYLGVPQDRLLFINSPMRFRRILIPKASFGYNLSISASYIRTISYLKNAVLNSEIFNELTPEEKIYFTRTNFNRARLMEVGEKDIEELFAACGYCVMSPEKLSFAEQVFYVANCKQFAGLSGTIMHNILFASENSSVTILNRTCMPNQPQFAINQASNAKVLYVDCYAKRILRYPKDYGGPKAGPILVEINNNLIRFLSDQGYDISNSSLRPKFALKIRNRIQYSYLSLRIRAKQSPKLTRIYQSIK